MNEAGIRRMQEDLAILRLALNTVAERYMTETRKRYNGGPMGDVINGTTILKEPTNIQLESFILEAKQEARETIKQWQDERQAVKNAIHARCIEEDKALRFAKLSEEGIQRHGEAYRKLADR